MNSDTRDSSKLWATSARLALLLPITLLFLLAMMLVHELGHALGALITGGSIVALDIRPGKISSTIVRPDPNPGLVLWAGFVFGWLFPFVSFPFWKIQQLYVGRILQAFASFCLLAGGSYLAVGGNEQLSDTGKLISQGCPHLVLVLIGLAIGLLGYWMLRRNTIDFLGFLKSRPPDVLCIACWWATLVVWYTLQTVLAAVVR